MPVKPGLQGIVMDTNPLFTLALDRFHVAKILGDAVERVRRSEWRKNKTVKGGRYALLKTLRISPNANEPN